MAHGLGQLSGNRLQAGSSGGGGGQKGTDWDNCNKIIITLKMKD